MSANQDGDGDADKDAEDDVDLLGERECEEALVRHVMECLTSCDRGEAFSRSRPEEVREAILRAIRDVNPPPCSSSSSSFRDTTNGSGSGGSWSWWSSAGAALVTGEKTYRLTAFAMRSMPRIIGVLGALHAVGAVNCANLLTGGGLLLASTLARRLPSRGGSKG